MSANKNKKAIVAGAAGFVGSHLCDLLLQKGYKVWGVDNLVTGQKKHAELLQKKGVEFVEADICKLTKWPEDVDEIYNMASPASPVDFADLPIEILNTGSQGHLNMLEIGRAKNARVLFASSSEIYGEAEVHPQHEKYFGNVNTLGPRGCYDEAKRYGEALSMAFHRKYKMPTRIVRIFNTYGPRMRPNDGRIIPNFFIQALQKKALTVYGDGSQTRSFCFVEDLVNGIFLLMQSSEATPVNIGNPAEYKVIEMAEKINKLTGNTVAHRYLPMPENDPKLRRPDITKAKSILQWEPKVSLETGLSQCLSYFKQCLDEQGSIETPNVK